MRLPASLVERIDEHLQLRALMDDPTSKSDLVRVAVSEYLNGFEREIEALRAAKAMMRGEPRE